jgi:hypothetical protein
MSALGGWVLERIYQHHLAREKKIQSDDSSDVSSDVSPEARATKRLWSTLIPSKSPTRVDISDLNKIRSAWKIISKMLYRCRSDIITQTIQIENTKDGNKLHVSTNDLIIDSSVPVLLSK